MYTATLSGLDPDTLYTCCLLLRNEKLGNSVPQCQNILQPIISSMTTPTVKAFQGLSPIGWAVGVTIGMLVGAGGTAFVLLVVVIAVKKKRASTSSSK